MKKNYYVVLLALVCSAFSCAMELGKHCCNSECYEVVRKRIDEEILGVTGGLFSSIRSAIESYRQCPTDREGTIKALCAVESKMPDACKGYQLFIDLKRWHWYFSHLIDNAMPYKHEQWESVTGATLGSLLSNLSEKNLDSRLSNRLHSYIHCEALQPYSKKMGLYQDLEERSFDNDDIHYLVLPGTTAGIKSVSFVQSSGGDYVKKVAWDESTSFYGLEDGNECAQTRQIIYETTCLANQYKVHRWEHMIVFGLVNRMGIIAIMQKLYANSTDKKIVVFKMPTFESFLCTKAFAASKDNKQELATMHEFVKVTPLVQGFVKRNLLQKIADRLKELEK